MKKKILAVIMAVILAFSCSSIAFASELDDQISSNAASIITEFLPAITPSSGLKKVIEVFQAVFAKLAPTVCSEQAKIENVVVSGGYDDETPFKTSFSMSTDIDYSSLRSNVIVSYEYQTYDGENWSGWSNIKDEKGFNVSFTRFNYGYLKNEDGVSYNSDFTTNRKIAAGTIVNCSPSKDKFASIAALKPGTLYEVKVTITVNNSYATTVYQTSGQSFVKA